MRTSLAIVGGGPAGLSAAITARELGVDVVLFEALAPGGEMGSLAELNGFTGASEPVTGPDLAASLIERAMDAGVVIEYVEVRELSRTSEGLWALDGGMCEADAVILATGGEANLSAIAGAKDLYESGGGVSICASCDGPLFKQKRVAVLGNGRDAAYEVAVLSQFAEGVVAVGDWSSAYGQRWQSGGERTNVEYVQASGPYELSKQDGLHVAAGELPVPLSVDGAFVAIGRRPRSISIPSVASGDGQAIAVDDRLRVVHAAAEGIYAIGDVRSGSSQTAAGALGDGATAAWDAWRTIQARASRA